jgi:hypothetical protein
VDPWLELCRARAVALLTPLGFGTKTTVVDGLAAGCHVLVHPVLHRRLARSEREACTPLDPARPGAPDRLADLLAAPPRHTWRNSARADEAFSVLAGVLSP